MAPYVVRNPYSATGSAPHNVFDWLAGHDSTYIGPGVSTLKQRRVNVYSVVQGVTLWAGRLGGVSGNSMGALWGPSRGIFPYASPAKTNPWQGFAT